MDTIYTLDEAAQKLGFSRKTLQREINAGRFPNSFKVGKRSCTRAGDVETYRQRMQSQDTEDIHRREREAAGRIQLQRELEMLRRHPFLSGGFISNPLVRTFSSDDPNRLP